MRSSTIKALILCRVMKCLTVYNNLLNKLCSSKKVAWVEIITCSLITRGDFMERQHHLIHSEAQTKSQILLSWDESIGSLIWAQIRPKQEKSVCVFMDEANWSHWADVAVSLGWSASEPSLRPPGALRLDHPIEVVFSPRRDPGCMGFRARSDERTSRPPARSSIMTPTLPSTQPKLNL